MNDHLITALKRASAVMPHLRTGQLILNALDPNHPDLEPLDLWQITDDELAVRLEDYARVEAERYGA